MSEDVTCTIQGNRGIPPQLQVIATDVEIQLDKLSARESSYYQGADPHFPYWSSTESLLTDDPQLLQQGDQIIDQEVIDPLTGTNRRFDISSEPEPFPDGHWEWYSDKFRGE